MRRKSCHGSISLLISSVYRFESLFHINILNKGLKPFNCVQREEATPSQAGKGTSFMPLQFFRLFQRGSDRKPRTIYPLLVLPMLAVVLIASTLTLYLRSFVQADPADTLAPFAGTVPAVVAHSKFNGSTNPQQTISLAIGLRLRNADMLKSYVEDISRPKSVNYHRYLSPSQFEGAFSPAQATHDTLLHYLKASGFTITHTYRHRMLIAFSGNVGLAEQVFRVSINNYTAPGGQIFYSNDSDPQLPSALVGQVESISGLNNALRWHHSQLAAHATSHGQLIPNTSCLGHGSNYYTPDQVQAAYNLNGIYNRGIHGEGQTVALFELGTFQAGDLAAYTSCYGHSHTSVQTIKAGSGLVPSDGGIVEVQLDAELVLSTAPSLGTLLIYEAANDTANYNAEWAQIVQDAPPVVSSSWGLCESDFGQAQVAQENDYFMTAAAQGQSIFASSGDSGSSGCYLDQGSPSQNALEAGDPAAQPFVTGVGGTSATWNGSTLSEITWNNKGGASGGGISLYWPMPSWQSASGVGTGNRESPDVSLNADPVRGYPVYCTALAAGCNANNPWLIVGGTSAASPMWAAMLAMTNEESVKAGGFNIGFVNPLLYQVASGASYAADFHDISSGNNDYKNLQGGKYAAGAVYDMATGLGSYNADALATQLVALKKANDGQRLAPASTTWYFPEGDEGSGFQEFITVQNPDPAQTANITITYVTWNQVVSAQHSVPPSTRQTFDAQVDLHTSPSGTRYNASAIVHVTSGPAVVVERPIYFNWNGIPSGMDAVGATHTAMSYYFSEGDTRQAGQAHYRTYIALLNPGSAAAHVTITYYTGQCSTNCPKEQITVNSMQHLPVSPTDVGLYQKVAIVVTSSDNPIVAERAMYFQDNIPSAGGFTTGAASVIGATAPGTDWLFAEGYTGVDFQEYFELANFGASPATVNIKLEYTSGNTQTYAVRVPAFGLTAFDVNAHRGSTNSLSAEITSDNPIVAQRLMYFHFSNLRISGGTDIVGEPGPASHNAYALAEGYTGGKFQEFLTLQNPTMRDENASITLFTPSLVFQLQVKIMAHSRKTLNINQVLNPIQPGAVSMTIQALGSNSVIVAERPMYFIFNIGGVPGTETGGSDVIGYTGS
jgi:kumamolisin